MDDDAAVQMTDREIIDFLGRGGTGVLSLADEGEAYAIPVSYGFDASARRFFVRLGFADESEKRTYLDASETARLVVYDEVASGWKSVIASGRIELVTDSDVDVSVVRVLREAELPIRTMFDVPPDDVEFEMYQLVVDDLSGRQTGESPETRES
ncbi:pyridoxamine 5'-phosphate oxidase family protein [Haladaptatus sp. NG-WS-4]